MLDAIRTFPGRDALRVADGLVKTYAEVFAGPPWNEGPDDAEDFRRRLSTDTALPGFRVCVAGDDTHPLGFATAWPTTLPLPPLRAYTRIERHLGRGSDLLAGTLEVDELAVSPRARRRGLGRRLLSAVTEGNGRAWLVTSPEATDAIDFYRRCGWREVPPFSNATGSTVVLFVSW